MRCGGASQHRNAGIHPILSRSVENSWYVKAQWVVKESDGMIRVGAIVSRESRVSDLERALLDAARRPTLVGGAAVLAEAVAVGSASVDTARLTRYAQTLGWASALRRVGSIADALALQGLAGRLHPVKATEGLHLTAHEPPRIAYVGPLGRERTLKLDLAADELVLNMGFRYSRRSATKLCLHAPAWCFRAWPRSIATLASTWSSFSP